MNDIRISTLKTVPKYGIDDEIYAIAFTNDSDTKYGKEKDEWERDSARIHKVRVKSISIDINSIDYWISDFNTDVEWGDSVPESQVSHDPKELFEYLTKRWKLNSYV